MNQGHFLTLLAGPVVAEPAPRGLIDNLAGVQVTSTAAPCTPSGFQLTFDLSSRSPLQTFFLLAGGIMTRVMRVILVATVNGATEVLIDGVVTRQDARPGTAAGTSTLTVTGLDLSAVMDWIDFSGVPLPAMPAEARVAMLLGKYAAFGIVPEVVPSVLVDVPIPTEQIPRQQGTDLGYIQSLAAQVGYVFYLEPGPAAGTSVAYWGPEIKTGAPQPALSVDMGAATNVEALDFEFNDESAQQPVVLIQDQDSGATIPVPIPDVASLSPALGVVAPLPRRIVPVAGTAKLGPVRAALLGLARAAHSLDAVTARGRLDVLRYGRPLRARQLVGVRGAGSALDGLYYVQSVTHDIRRGEYKQSFTLTRNALFPIQRTVQV